MQGISGDVYVMPRVARQISQTSCVMVFDRFGVKIAVTFFIGVSTSRRRLRK